MQHDQKTNETAHSRAEEPARKPYTPPRLSMYGTVEELTQATLQQGSDNNPGFPNGSAL